MPGAGSGIGAAVRAGPGQRRGDRPVQAPPPGRGHLGVHHRSQQRVGELQPATGAGHDAGVFGFGQALDYLNILRGGRGHQGHRRPGRGRNHQQCLASTGRKRLQPVPHQLADRRRYRQRVGGGRYPPPDQRPGYFQSEERISP